MRKNDAGPPAWSGIGPPPGQPEEYLNPGTIRNLYTSRLISGSSYQRTLDEKVVEKLVRCWDRMLMEPIVVSYRDGKYYVIDGQHRVAALRALFQDKDTLVPCIVHTGLTKKDEAALFYKLDRSRRKLSYAQSISALLKSGESAEINDIQALLDGYGFEWALDGKSMGDYKIRSTRAVVSAYRMTGHETFPRMLSLLSETWDGDPASLTAMMLTGTARFLKSYELEINDHYFVSRLKDVKPEDIAKATKEYRTIRKSDVRCACVLLYYYNKSIRDQEKKLNPLELM
ncbi:MAG: ParB N-terminal domain-containing protein [Abditibacteriota bacterium]|nr:ParB N-terminal domain-containing protein [Abditibacteriota bacterium]